MPGDCQAGLLIRRDLYNAALAAQRCSDVEISLGVKREALRPSQSAIKDGNCAVRIDAVNGVKAGVCGACDVQSAIRRKSKMIGGNAGLQSRKDKNLPVRRDAPDGPAAITNV